jgi:hypothetical protein
MRTALATLAILAAAIAASHALAIAGEPQSQWLWRDVLGIIGDLQ